MPNDGFPPVVEPEYRPEPSLDAEALVEIAIQDPLAELAHGACSS